jgi:hypothetical protein
MCALSRITSSSFHRISARELGPAQRWNRISVVWSHCFVSLCACVWSIAHATVLQALALHVLSPDRHHCGCMFVAPGDSHLHFLTHFFSMSPRARQALPHRRPQHSDGALLSGFVLFTRCAMPLHSSLSAGTAHAISRPGSINYWRHPCHGLRRLIDVFAVVTGDATTGLLLQNSKPRFPSSANLTFLSSQEACTNSFS